MAITRLTDLVSTMKTKWTYGDSDFAYTFEVNEKHNTTYPYMMINPPNSEMPEVYGGWEAYDFEVDFFQLYQTAAQDAVSLEQRWDNLQDLALEWLDNVMIFYNNPTGADVGVYFLEETLDFDRVKEVANDRLVQIKMSFTMRAVTRCMFGSIPSTYPSQLSDLVIWLRADSGVTFNNVTHNVSAWADYSGYDNNVSPPAVGNAAKRYTYDGAQDKTMMGFNGYVSFFRSDSNCPITSSFTMFTVAKANIPTNQRAIANAYSTRFISGVNDYVTIPNAAGGAGGQLFSFTDGANDDQPFSVSLWANTDVGPRPASGGGWIGKVGAQDEWLFYADDDGVIHAELYDSAGGGNIKASVTGMADKAGEWHHYAMTYDGSNSETGIEIYIDGVASQNSQTTTGTYNGMQLTASVVGIGKDQDGASVSYEGYIDEVSIYSFELTDVNVDHLYNNRMPAIANVAGTGMIGYWKMGDGATYPTIPDDSSNSNDATMVSMSAANFVENVPTQENSPYLTYESGDVRIILGSTSSQLYCRVADAVPAAGEWHARYLWDDVDTSTHHIGMMTLDAATSTLALEYNNSASSSLTMPNYDNTTTFTATTFDVGYGTQFLFLDGNMQEVIVYNRALAEVEIDTIKSYLNNKYKIY